MPLDLSNIQMSAWLSMIPTSIYLWLNISILKKDNMEEYLYFKNEGGITKLKYFWYSSILVGLCYLGVVLMNISFLVMPDSRQLWQNFEGLIVYSLITTMMTSLYYYSLNKFDDFNTAI